MELNEIIALLETQFPGVRKDGLNQLARVIAMQVNTKEEATGIVGKLTEVCSGLAQRRGR